MQLAHLIPQLDAEIDRLQRARDLLTFHLKFRSIVESIDSKYDVQQAVPAESILNSKREKSKPVSSDALPVASSLSSPPPPGEREKAQRLSTRGTEARHDRRRRVILLDTALRGTVPAGPVVVSAEEVRKAQASKTAQSTRAAEAKKAGAELVTSFAWRNQAGTRSQVSSLLQRLMNIGEQNADQENGDHLSTLGRRESFDRVQEPLTLKST